MKRLPRWRWPSTCRPASSVPACDRCAPTFPSSTSTAGREGCWSRRRAAGIGNASRAASRAGARCDESAEARAGDCRGPSLRGAAGAALVGSTAGVTGGCTRKDTAGVGSSRGPGAAADGMSRRGPRVHCSVKSTNASTSTTPTVRTDVLSGIAGKERSRTVRFAERVMPRPTAWIMVALARAEGLEGHARSIEIRVRGAGSAGAMFQRRRTRRRD